MSNEITAPIAGPADTMVAFEAVIKRFGGTGGQPDFTALDGVDLTVAKGGITGIIGRSGAGKSTLIRLVNGLEKTTSGRVVVRSEEHTSELPSLMRISYAVFGL